MVRWIVRLILELFLVPASASLNKNFLPSFSVTILERGRVLFNDTVNTFYLRLYGVRHMVKDHSDSKQGNPLLPHGLLFHYSSKGSFICTISDRTAHTSAFVTPVVKHWLEQEIAQHYEGSIRANAFTTKLHLAPPLRDFLFM